MGYTVGRIFRRAAVWPEAHSFYFQGASPVGVLLLHATSGTPWEMRDLGEFLYAHELSVACPRFTGHGTYAEALYAVRYRDYLRDAMQAYKRLRAHCRDVFVVGHCGGGRIALELQLRRMAHFAGFVTLSLPMLDPPQQSLASRVRARLTPRSLPLFGVVNLSPIASHCIHPHASTPWLSYLSHRPASFLDAMSRQRARQLRQLRHIRQPFLVIHSSHDHLYAFEHARALYDALGSTQKALHVVEGVTHLLTTHEEQSPALFARIERFIAEHGAARACA